MLKKTIMKKQEPHLRNTNFEETAYGYSPEEAKRESARCLRCKTKPCVSGCPVNVAIPEFIDLISKDKFEEAYEKIKETNTLPAVCGRVCPQESQCESYCVRKAKGEPVAIGNLERFVADYHIQNSNENRKTPDIVKKNSKKIAVVGSGPAGLSCAGDLIKLGYEVTIFEAFHEAGGVLVYGIPQFRLPKEIVRREIESLKKLGVEIKLNMVIGKILTIDELFENGYSAVFIATGAGLPAFMNIKGENLNGVYSANEFLTRINLMKAYKFPIYDTPVKISENVAVIGGGNVAMDAARSAKRLGVKNVYIIYRRSKTELPARTEEVHNAMEEGIEFIFLASPVEILGSKSVEGIRCIKTKLKEPDKSGRRKSVGIPGSEFDIKVENVIVAIGQSPNLVVRTEDIDIDGRNCIITNEKCETTKKGVYAGGDSVLGAATVILAMGAGKNAALNIHEYLK